MNQLRLPSLLAWIAAGILCVTSVSASAQSSSTWTPTGWNYNAPPNIYALNRSAWLYTAAPIPQVNLATGRWSSLDSASGWLYYEWPYFFSLNSGRWHYTAEDPEQWVYDFGQGQWKTLGHASTPSASGNALSNSSLFVQQSWSENGSRVTVNRDALVRVPSGKSGRLPVLISLHGNGGTPEHFYEQWEYLKNVIHVVPRGHLNSWNVLDDASFAPDVDFVASLISQLRTYSNVDSSRIAVLGYSNGSDLINRLLIEAPGDLFRTAISVASPLTTKQYRDGSFWTDPSGTRAFDRRATPAAGRRIVTVNGTNDEFIPYYGGDLQGFTFHPSQTSAYYWARAMGHSGSQDTSSSQFDGSTEVYSYLEGQVKHYKISGADHGLNVGNVGGVSLRAVVEAVLKE